jgi:metal-dependent HD superfamily phosphatase/phosphodiesterase
MVNSIRVLKQSGRFIKNMKVLRKITIFKVPRIVSKIYGEKLRKMTHAKQQILQLIIKEDENIQNMTDYQDEA